MTITVWPTRITVRDKKFIPVNSCFATPVHFAKGYQQKIDVNPDIGHRPEVKYVNDASCVILNLIRLL